MTRTRKSRPLSFRLFPHSSLTRSLNVWIFRSGSWRSCAATKVKLLEFPVTSFEFLRVLPDLIVGSLKRRRHPVEGAAKIRKFALPRCFDAMSEVAAGDMPYAFGEFPDIPHDAPAGEEGDRGIGEDDRDQEGKDSDAGVALGRDNPGLADLHEPIGIVGDETNLGPELGGKHVLTFGLDAASRPCPLGDKLVEEGTEFLVISAYLPDQGLLPGIGGGHVLKELAQTPAHVADLLHVALARFLLERGDQEIQGKGFADDLVVSLAAGEVVAYAPQD